MVDKAFSFGDRTILAKLTSGFGFYIETIPHSMRPALVSDDDDPDQVHMEFIDYSGTAIKFPFFTIEFGKYKFLQDMVIDLGEDDDDESL